LADYVNIKWTYDHLQISQKKLNIFVCTVQKTNGGFEELHRIKPFLGEMWFKEDQPCKPVI